MPAAADPGSSDVISVALATDRSYLPFLGVTLSSLLRHTKSKLRIFLLSADLGADDLRQLQELTSVYNASIERLTPERSRYKNALVSGHISIVTYDRLLLPYLLPPDVDRVLYLDADLLVCDDIAKLWNVELKGGLLAAVEDPSFQLFAKLGISPNNGYFNAGVLLIDLELWRRADISTNALEYLNDHPERLTWHDQCTLNAILTGKWLSLPPRWNLQYAMLGMKGPRRDGAAMRLKYKDDIRAPGVVHFTTKEKPWRPSVVHPWKKDFFQELERTPWRSWRSEEAKGTRQALLKKVALLSRWARMGSALADIWSIRHGRA